MKKKKSKIPRKKIFSRLLVLLASLFVIGLLALIISGVYYFAYFLPTQQKAIFELEKQRFEQEKQELVNQVNELSGEKNSLSNDLEKEKSKPPEVVVKEIPTETSNNDKYKEIAKEEFIKQGIRSMFTVPQDTSTNSY